MSFQQEILVAVVGAAAGSLMTLLGVAIKGGYKRSKQKGVLAEWRKIEPITYVGGSYSNWVPNPIELNAHLNLINTNDTQLNIEKISAGLSFITSPSSWNVSAVGQIEKEILPMPLEPMKPHYLRFKFNLIPNSQNSAGNWDSHIFLMQLNEFKDGLIKINYITNDGKSKNIEMALDLNQEYRKVYKEFIDEALRNNGCIGYETSGNCFILKGILEKI